MSSNGIVNNTSINSGGLQDVYEGGSANRTVVFNGGQQDVFSGGIANTAIVSAGGKQLVYWNRMANGTLIGPGGIQEVYSSGTVSGTIINSGGEQYIWETGTAYNTTIKSGGYMGVDVGGTVYGLTIESGGSSYISRTSANVISLGDVENNGSIRIDNPDKYQRTYIDKLSGSDGSFYTQFMFGHGTDRIIITSSHEGNHILKFKDYYDNGADTPIIEGDGLLMVQYADTVADSNITGTFFGSYDRGAYLYTLQKGKVDGTGRDYYLRNALDSSGNFEYTPLYKSMLTVPLMNFAALKVSMASLNNHITSLRDMNNVETTNGVWYRGNYSNLTLSKFGDIDIKYQGMDAGWEWKWFRKTDDLEKGPRGFYMGITASHTGLSMQDKKKEKSGSFADGGSLIAGGVYGTYVSDNGFFWDFSGKYGQNSIEMTQQTSDDDLLSYNPKRNIMIGGAELGWALSMGQNKTGLTFVPKAGYQIMNADKADIDVKNFYAKKVGMVNYGGASYSAITGSLSISYIPKDKSGFYIEPFAEATYSSLSGDEEVTYAGVTEKSEIDKSMLEVYAGFDMTFSRNFSLHLAGSMMKSESIKSVGGDLGLTFKFGGKNAETF